MPTLVSISGSCGPTPRASAGRSLSMDLEWPAHGDTRKELLQNSEMFPSLLVLWIVRRCVRAPVLS